MNGGVRRGETGLCPGSISDGIVTVTCSLAPGHDDDHGRGFLRWADDSFWYSQRSRTSDGRWHALPYPADGEE